VSGSPAFFARLLTLEFDLTFPASGPGRRQFFQTTAAAPAVISACLVTPTNMVYGASSGQLVVAELATGQLVLLPVNL